MTTTMKKKKMKRKNDLSILEGSGREGSSDEDVSMHGLSALFPPYNELDEPRFTITTTVLLI